MDKIMVAGPIQQFSSNCNLIKFPLCYVQSDDVRRAASTIERRWKAKQYKKQFNSLKRAICRAVSSIVW